MFIPTGFRLFVCSYSTFRRFRYFFMAGCKFITSLQFGSHYWRLQLLTFCNFFFSFTSSSVYRNFEIICKVILSLLQFNNPFLSEFEFNSTLWWVSNILARGCRNVCVFADQKDLLENFKTVVEVWRRFSVREPFYLFQTMVSKEKVAELRLSFLLLSVFYLQYLTTVFIRI